MVKKQVLKPGERFGKVTEVRWRQRTSTDTAAAAYFVNLLRSWLGKNRSHSHALPFRRRIIYHRHSATLTDKPQIYSNLSTNARERPVMASDDDSKSRGVQFEQAEVSPSNRRLFWQESRQFCGIK